MLLGYHEDIKARKVLAPLCNYTINYTIRANSLRVINIRGELTHDKQNHRFKNHIIYITLTYGFIFTCKIRTNQNLSFQLLNWNDIHYIQDIKVLFSIETKHNTLHRKCKILFPRMTLHVIVYLIYTGYFRISDTVFCFNNLKWHLFNEKSNAFL